MKVTPSHDEKGFNICPKRQFFRGKYVRKCTGSGFGCFADNQPMEVEKPMQTPIVFNHVETIEQIPVSELQESASNQ